MAVGTIGSGVALSALYFGSVVARERGGDGGSGGGLVGGDRMVLGAVQAAVINQLGSDWRWWMSAAAVTAAAVFAG